MSLESHTTLTPARCRRRTLAFLRLVARALPLQAVLWLEANADKVAIEWRPWIVNFYCAPVVSVWFSNRELFNAAMEILESEYLQWPGTPTGIEDVAYRVVRFPSRNSDTPGMRRHHIQVAKRLAASAQLAMIGKHGAT